MTYNPHQVSFQKLLKSRRTGPDEQDTYNPKLVKQPQPAKPASSMGIPVKAPINGQSIKGCGGDKITDFFYKESEIKTLPIFRGDVPEHSASRSRHMKLVNHLLHNCADYEKSVMTCLESDHRSVPQSRFEVEKSIHRSKRKPERYLSSLDDDFIVELICDENMVNLKKRGYNQVSGNETVADIVRKRRALAQAAATADRVNIDSNSNEAFTTVYDLEQGLPVTL
ncbi:hypothetical protein SeMB42_g03790 [Synchytrium endobioticum]|uniref:Uncharacterized protein n=1 Tax=Synchytrium endobioticum TaxID=286115 RepID=A0A507D453_9FUNG|nr:hypothetical protein SeMB42_g03790 [Synchytrium endobioticum]TPX48347.1 hypothetical protein SeLEV6574_g02090 [Synchytrium endobioticum]